MESVDLEAARTAVCEWLDRHQSSALAQMVDDLKSHYPDFPDEMAVVLRGMMAAELRRRTAPPELIPPVAQAATRYRS
jgi:hypothetical protein